MPAERLKVAPVMVKLPLIVLLPEMVLIPEPERVRLFTVVGSNDKMS